MIRNIAKKMLMVVSFCFLGCNFSIAQKLLVYRVVGKVTHTVQGKQMPLNMNMSIDYHTEISIPYGGKIELMDEEHSKRLILKKPGRGNVKALVAGTENSIMDITKQYLAYVKKQMTNKGLVSQQRYTDFATVTREIDSVALDKNGMSPSSSGGAFKSRYDRLSRGSRQKYFNFRDECNRKYIDFVRKAWAKHNQIQAVEKPEEPRIEPQRVPDSLDIESLPLQDNKKSVAEEKPLPKTIDKPQPPIAPVVPIMEVEENDEDRQFCCMPFSFYGINLEVRLDEGRRIDLGQVTPDRVADALQHFSTKEYDNLLFDCLKIKDKYKLCDWAYLLMLKSLTDQYCGVGTDEGALLMGYLYYQSGYRIRFATDGKKLYLLVASDHTIFGKGSYDIKGRKYYPLEDVEGALSICEAAFPKERTLSLYIPEQPLLGGEEEEVRRIVSQKYPEIAIEVAVNHNLLDFYDSYPSSYVGNDVTTRWTMYANSPMAENVQECMYTVLREKLTGLSQVDAVNRLLNLVQTGFVYEYDDKVWGGDRAFFAEETLHYPFCDCEDRAILFARLVRDILKMKCVLVFYPGHLAAAVHFDEQPRGTFYTASDGKNYTICDPTYIGACVGMEMPLLEQSKVTLIHIKN